MTLSNTLFWIGWAGLIIGIILSYSRADDLWAEGAYVAGLLVITASVFTNSRVGWTARWSLSGMFLVIIVLMSWRYAHRYLHRTRAYTLVKADPETEE